MAYCVGVVELESTSVKANMGHLEPSAAAAGLGSLLGMRDGTSIAMNAQLNQLFGFYTPQ